ncbi:MAG: polyprenol monophosphomannose synthase [Alphaproteobacteria bacterium]
MSAPRLSIIVPTYREAENIAPLVARVEAATEPLAETREMLIVDDSSGDGIDGVVAGLDRPWVRLIARTAPRDLSGAVLDGLRAARGEVLVVMDADLSHPPESIPDLLAALEAGADMAVGSRYVPGAAIAEAWGGGRHLNSRAGTLLARLFTPLRDPMSGFFALTRATLAGAGRLNPIGYKILLELLVKCRPARVVEVPIRFADRERGESKLNLAQQIRFLRHVGRLLRYRLTP